MFQSGSETRAGPLVITSSKLFVVYSFVNACQTMCWSSAKAAAGGGDKVIHHTQKTAPFDWELVLIPYSATTHTHTHEHRSKPESASTLPNNR